MAQQRTSGQWVPTALRVVLYLQAALATFVGLAAVLGLEGFAHDAEDGRRIGVGFWAIAVIMLTVVIPQFKREGERRILLVPLAWTAFHLGDSLYELLVISDAAFLPAVVIEVVFLAIYLAGYKALSRQ